jgi:hypothetical protein
VVDRSLRHAAHRRLREIAPQTGWLTEALDQQGDMAYFVGGN